MKKFRMALTVGILAAGMVSVWFRPQTAAVVGPLMGAAVSYWFGGSNGNQGGTGGNGASAGGGEGQGAAATNG
jgi:hypothetical protein